MAIAANVPPAAVAAFLFNFGNFIMSTPLTVHTPLIILFNFITCFIRSQVCYSNLYNKSQANSRELPLRVQRSFALFLDEADSGS
jgi:hypothetical protein